MNPTSAAAKPQSFPNQAHQPIALRAATRIAMAAGGEDQADMLHGARLGSNGPRYLVRESNPDQQGMRGVKVVMMKCDFRMRSPRLADGLAQSLPLHQIEIE